MERTEFFRRRRDVALLVGLAFLLALVLGIAIHAQATSRLIREAKDDLLLLETARSSALQNFLETVHSEAVLWGDHGPVRDGLEVLSAAWQELDPDAGERLRRLYVNENPHPEAERHLYNQAPDRSAYTLYHTTVQPAVRRFLQVNEYHDILLCGSDGDVLYSFYKEEDFATNLVSGPWRDTDLGIVFRQARDAAKGEVVFSDFERYEPSANAPTAFVAGPVFKGDGSLLGVLIFQISVERINEIMQFTEGMGETGETYLVGTDHLMRSDSRFSDESVILVQSVESETVRRALAGESGVEITEGYRGEEVISAYGLLEFAGIRWAVIAEIDLEDVLRPARRLRRNLFLAGIVILLLVAVAATVNPPPLTRN